MDNKMQFNYKKRQGISLNKKKCRTGLRLKFGRVIMTTKIVPSYVLNQTNPSRFGSSKFRQRKF